MKTATLATAIGLAVVGIFAVPAFRPSDDAKQIVPVELSTLRHGYLANVAYIVDRDGITYRDDQFAFLAIRLPNVPAMPQPVDYLQGSIARRVYTDEAINDWMILRLDRGPLGEVSTATVTVCPPGSMAHVGECFATNNGIVPLYVGVPTMFEPSSRRRAVRK